MNTPEWLKPGLIGALAGGISVAILGFSWAGWMTSSSADNMARSMSAKQVTEAFVPVCVGMSTTDPARLTKLETITGTPLSGRRDALMQTGWATLPGATAPDRDLATACLAALALPTS
ncbi:hypothetical protein G5B31_18760 [Rhodobacter sp. SGA-6-6]|uniref:hypothetical protein n=1 Tax=Rhodobacter sp. SGA-6-6 TaxID=2710882 RepID=UPI0013EE0C05|nr:hypothetical protein [Rhodobacter sp. SGA-6-6]NGM47581.1 hypothetical protein [Rhodobacter sp. SGA-6-6]